MKLQDLFYAKNIILQILWGEKTIEFYTTVIDKEDDCIFVSPYYHNGSPLTLNIHLTSGVICNIFGDNPENGQRISFRNIELKTVELRGHTYYRLNTTIFNSEAQLDERRVEDRIQITKSAKLLDTVSQKTVPVRIHDISDSGIAFYAPTTFQPETNAFVISFSDSVGEEFFDLRIHCKSVRMKKMPGTIFYGCRVAEDNNDYLLYGCLMRLTKNA